LLLRGAMPFQAALALVLAASALAVGVNGELAAWARQYSDGTCTTLTVETSIAVGKCFCSATADGSIYDPPCKAQDTGMFYECSNGFVSAITNYYDTVNDTPGPHSCDTGGDPSDQAVIDAFAVDCTTREDGTSYSITCEDDGGGGSSDDEDEDTPLKDEDTPLTVTIYSVEATLKLMGLDETTTVEELKAALAFLVGGDPEKIEILDASVGGRRRLLQEGLTVNFVATTDDQASSATVELQIKSTDQFLASVQESLPAVTGAEVISVEAKEETVEEETENDGVTESPAAPRAPLAAAALCAAATFAAL